MEVFFWIQVNWCVSGAKSSVFIVNAIWIECRSVRMNWAYKLNYVIQSISITIWYPSKYGSCLQIIDYDWTMETHKYFFLFCLFLGTRNKRLIVMKKKSVSKFPYKYMIKPYMYSPSKFSYKLLNSMPLWSNTYINCFCISPCISYDNIKQQLTK